MAERFRRKDAKPTRCGNAECGKRFTPKTYNQRFCGPQCKADHNNGVTMQKLQAYDEAVESGAIDPVKSCENP